MEPKSVVMENKVVENLDGNNTKTLPPSPASDGFEDDDFNYIAGWRLHLITAGYVSTCIFAIRDTDML